MTVEVALALPVPLALGGVLLTLLAWLKVSLSVPLSVGV